MAASASTAVASSQNHRIPEVVVIGGKMDRKITLVEALVGFRFNANEIEMGTRRSLFVHMVKEPTAAQPTCRFKEEDSEKYGSLMAPTAIANLISKRTEWHLQEIQAAVSSRPIVMRAEYAHYSNLTIIVTPGLVLNQFKRGDLESTPDEILSIVKSLAGEPHRHILFLQQSSVDLCSSICLDRLKEIDPIFKRTFIVLSMFDKRLKELKERPEVRTFLRASGYHGDYLPPFFLALPDADGTSSNGDFQREINQVEKIVLCYLQGNVNGGFDKGKYGSYVGFRCLCKHLVEFIQKRNMAFLDHKCSKVSVGSPDSELQVKTNVSQLRILAMLRATSIYNRLLELLDGSAYPPPKMWGNLRRRNKSLGCVWMSILRALVLN